MKHLFYIIIVFFLSNIYFYPEIFKFSFKNITNYDMTVRSNFRVYKNKKYMGLISHEYKGLFNVNTSSVNHNISGKVFLLEKTIKNQVMLGYFVDNIVETNFSIDNFGSYNEEIGDGFPYLRGVPNFPDKNISEGDVFYGYGENFIKIENNYLLPIKSATRYVGKKILFEELYDFFEISYSFFDTNNYDEIKKVNAKHNLKLYFDNQRGIPVFIEDHFSEIFNIGEDEFKRDGFNLYFYKSISPMNKDIIIADLSDDIIIDPILTDEILIEKNDDGISLILQNLKFKPNLSILLDSEYQKLDSIYNILSKIKDRSFFIAGHSALSGTEEQQKKISLDRAKTVVDYLIKMGMDPKKILYGGMGAKYPIAPNDSEENMQKNRRVEIKILEN